MRVSDLATIRLFIDLNSRKQKQAAVQEVPSGAYIEELPDDATVTEETVAPGSQEGTNTSAEDPSQKRVRNQRRSNGRRNKVSWAKAPRPRK